MVCVRGPEMFCGWDLPEPVWPLRGHCPLTQVQSPLWAPREEEALWKRREGNATFIILNVALNKLFNLEAKGRYFYIFPTKKLRDAQGLKNKSENAKVSKGKK